MSNTAFSKMMTSSGAVRHGCWVRNAIPLLRSRLHRATMAEMQKLLNRVIAKHTRGVYRRGLDKGPGDCREARRCKRGRAFAVQRAGPGRLPGCPLRRRFGGGGALYSDAA